MSRSRRKTPCEANTCAESDQWCKKKASRRVRKLTREALIAGEEAPLAREAFNSYLFQKDGKHFFDPSSESGQKGMRK